MIILKKNKTHIKRFKMLILKQKKKIQIGPLFGIAGNAETAGGNPSYDAFMDGIRDNPLSIAGDPAKSFNYLLTGVHNKT
jgi:hypothetical protein